MSPDHPDGGALRSLQLPPLLRDVAVLGTGRALPSRKITNHDLRSYVRNYDESSGDFALWVDRVTHIQERSWIDPMTESAGALGATAAQRAIEASGVAPAEIDHLIFCSFTYNEIFPGEHVRMIRDLGMNCGGIQMTAACAGTVYGLSLAKALVASGECRNVLLVASECLSRATNFEDPITAILFSDAAGAMVVGRKTDGADTGFAGRTILRTEYDACAIHMRNGNATTPDRFVDPAGKHVLRPYLAMEGGPRVLRNAVNRMADAVVECLGFTPKDLKEGNPELRALLDRAKIIPHQANGRIVDGLQEKLGGPRENTYRTIYHLGNCSAATNAYTLDYGIREGNLDRHDPVADSGAMGTVAPCGTNIRKGDLVVIASIGAGYSYGAMAFVQAY